MSPFLSAQTCAQADLRSRAFIRNLEKGTRSIVERHGVERHGVERQVPSSSQAACQTSLASPTLPLPTPKVKGSVDAAEFWTSLVPDLLCFLLNA